MYDAEGKTFLLGDPLTYTVGGTPKTFDLLRVGEKNRAVIGDKRNDENVIVSQLQGAFLQFHNRLVKENPTLSFKEIQRKVRWHYQYVVLNDYLPRIVGDETMQKVWPGWKNGNTCDNKPKLCFYHFHGSAYMPIEFSAAAYRFGHSMVRPIYRLNTLHDQSITGEHPGLAGRFFIFAGVQKRGLNGFGKFPSNWAIDWSLYFDINGSSARVGKERVQPAYKIDASMVNPLAFLPEFSKPPIPFTANTPMEVKDLQSKEVNHKSPNNLATRNLWRGNSMGLPSGQDVARAMGEEALKESELFVGKAQLKDDGSVDEKPLSTVENNYFAGNAPLWYYVLAEANAQWRKNKGSKKGDDANKVSVTLGPVGGRIVAETLIGLLLADSHSYLNQYPLWKPTSPIAPNGKPFTMGDFIKYALNL